MPTGYTAAIADGVTFEQFALNCARAFGALIDMRDEPSDAPIPERFEPSNYHEKKIAEINDELVRLKEMSQDEAKMVAHQEWRAAEQHRLERLEESRALRAKYEAMLAKVEAWMPPTDEHWRLHEFMIEQIMSSINFDCNEDYYSKPTVKLSGVQWRKDRRLMLSKSLDYHHQQHADEVRRAEERTNWVSSLRKSLTA